MQFAKPTLGITLALASIMLLAGCVQQPAPIVPTAAPTVTPVFATDADALAAAKKAYTAYSAVTDQIAADGGREPDRIGTVVTQKWLPHEVKAFRKFATTGEHFTGKGSWTYFQLQRRVEGATGIADVHVYVCDDVSNTRIIDAAGHDVTPASRKNFFPVVADFQSATAGSAKLLFAGSDPWSGDDFCH